MVRPGLDPCEARGMPPIVLALIDAVLALALHHDRRARQASTVAAGSSVCAEVAGPEDGGPFPGAFVLRVTIRTPAEGDEAEMCARSRELRIDLDEERLLAPELALAELELTRGGLARIIGELEAWCYEQIPVEAADVEPARAPAKA